VAVRSTYSRNAGVLPIDKAISKTAVSLSNGLNTRRFNTPGQTKTGKPERFKITG